MDIDADIQRALVTMNGRETEYAKALQDAVVADHAYRMAKAAAYLRHEGTIQEREYKALEDCNELLLVRDKAVAYRDLCREYLLDVRAALSARQSILSASVRVHDLTKNMLP